MFGRDLNAINKQHVINLFVGSTLNEAANELGLGVTAFKKKCREMGFKRWPHRQIKSLDNLEKHIKLLIPQPKGNYKHLQVYLKNKAIQKQKKLFDIKMKTVLNHIQFHRDKLMNNPSYKIPESIIKLRQRNFKQRYKKNKNCE